MKGSDMVNAARSRVSAGQASDQNPRRPQAVLWDMDGTLVETEPYWLAAEFDLVEEFGTTWSEDQGRYLVGRDLMFTADYLREHGGVDLPSVEIVHHLQTRVIQRVREHLPWRPGAQELLTALSAAGVPQALVTMSWSALAEAIVSRLPADTFSAVVTGDVVRRGKPHPDPYLLALAELGLPATDVVAVEDSPTGIASAVAAGLQVLAVPYLVDVTRIDGVAPDSYRIVNSLNELQPGGLLFR